MSLIYRSPKGEILLNEQGFIEFVAHEHRTLEQADLEEMRSAVERAGLTDVRLLVSRFNEYGVPEDFNLIRFRDIEPLRLLRVACFAPSPGDHVFAQVMKISAFHDVPCEVFSGRGEAIRWLMSDEFLAPAGEK